MNQATQPKRRVTDFAPDRRKANLANVPRVPPHVQACVAAAVLEALSLRRSMGEQPFARDAQAQMLVGFVKGAALGLEMSQHELVELVKPLIRDEDTDALWTPLC